MPLHHWQSHHREVRTTATLHPVFPPSPCPGVLPQRDVCIPPLLSAIPNQKVHTSPLTLHRDVHRTGILPQVFLPSLHPGVLHQRVATTLPPSPTSVATATDEEEEVENDTLPPPGPVLNTTMVAQTLEAVGQMGYRATTPLPHDVPTRHGSFLAQPPHQPTLESQEYASVSTLGNPDMAQKPQRTSPLSHID